MLVVVLVVVLRTRFDDDDEHENDDDFQSNKVELGNSVVVFRGGIMSDMSDMSDVSDAPPPKKNTLS